MTTVPIWRSLLVCAGTQYRCRRRDGRLASRGLPPGPRPHGMQGIAVLWWMAHRTPDRSSGAIFDPTDRTADHGHSRSSAPIAIATTNDATTSAWRYHCGRWGLADLAPEFSSARINHMLAVRDEDRGAPSPRSYVGVAGHVSVAASRSEEEVQRTPTLRRRRAICCDQRVSDLALSQSKVA